MKYDGAVIRIKGKPDFIDEEIIDDRDKFILFLVDPKTQKMQDGINISVQKNIYDDMKYDQLMVVSVIFKDGTKELEEIDLDQFIHGDKYCKYNVFLWINDLLLFNIGKPDDGDTMMDIIKRLEFSVVAMDCIDSAKKKIQELTDSLVQ